MDQLTLTLHKTKDTKNKVVYGTKDGAVIQRVYIDKDALGDVPPATLKDEISGICDEIMEMCDDLLTKTRVTG